MSQHLLPIVRAIVGKAERSPEETEVIEKAREWARRCRAKSWQAREILSLLGEA